jgi:hypothetical protein
MTHWKERHLDLFEHTTFDQPREKGDDIGVFVLPNAVVQLQVQGVGKFTIPCLLLSFDHSIKRLNRKVGITIQILPPTVKDWFSTPTMGQPDLKMHLKAYPITVVLRLLEE